MNSLPSTLFVTDREGGEWIAFADFNGKAVHSIKFENGEIWDCVSGWRKYREQTYDLHAPGWNHP